MPLPVLFLVVFFLAAGCSEPEISDAPPKRADDRITSAELMSFLSIIQSLPEGKLSSMPVVFRPPPQWSRNRTLPVHELVKDEEKLLVEHRSIDWLAAHCPDSRFLKRALRREKMTLDQFVGLWLALGITASRAALADDRDLEEILLYGKIAVSGLKRDHRIFSVLGEDEAFVVQEEASWVTLTHRAETLKLVHPSNLKLVREHREELVAVLPSEFTRNPLEEFSSILDDRGIPFTEAVGGESDQKIPWSRANAIVGIDAPSGAREPASQRLRDARP